MTPYERLNFALSEQGKWVKVLEANGCRVELPKPGRELDAPVRMNGLKFDRADAQRLVAQTALQCRYYAKAPLIRDTFGRDHNKRRKFRDQMWSMHGDKLYEFYKLNKLRANAIDGLVRSLFVFVERLDIDNVRSSQADAVKKLYKQMPSDKLGGYQDLPEREKLAVARKLDRIARDFLKIVTGLA